MPSPFPGMDPYFEQRSVWAGFHNQFIAEVRRLLTATLPSQYATTLEERLVIAYDDWDEPTGGIRQRSVQPDISVTTASSAGDEAVAVVLNSPAKLVEGPAEMKETWIEVVRVEDGQTRTVTVVEVLSYSNKYPGPDCDRFESRRAALFGTRTHYVEIDLLRGGRRLPGEWPIPHPDYAVVICPYPNRFPAALWPISIRKPLPTVMIPLDDGETVNVDLQAAVTATYELERPVARGLYRQKPQPPIKQADQDWVEEQLQAAGIAIDNEP